VALASLFGSSFLSATLLPGNSEVLLVALLSAGSAMPAALVLSASVGNTLGGITNVIIGRFSAAAKASAWVTCCTRLAEALRTGRFIAELATGDWRCVMRFSRLAANAVGSGGLFHVYWKSGALRSYYCGNATGAFMVRLDWHQSSIMVTSMQTHYACKSMISQSGRSI
jgi:hypothetical protein